MLKSSSNKTDIKNFLYHSFKINNVDNDIYVLGVKTTRLIDSFLNQILDRLINIGLLNIKIK